MMMPDKVDILKATQVPNPTQGGYITKYVLDRTIQCNFQPVSYNTLYRPYGIADTTSNIVFCKDFNVIADNRIKKGNFTYKIDSIKNYGVHHAEIAVSKVVG
ncbi:hypothetical protein NL50_17380 [Clostridium acetobutylicum]|nr:hypothetical protein NL50_17380 [Clostridium acetobutylicum]